MAEWILESWESFIGITSFDDKVLFQVMLLDGETTPIVSLAFAQSALMRHEVYLFEKLQPNPLYEDMRHLKCIVIARPESSVSMLCSELSNPR